MTTRPPDFDDLVGGDPGQQVLDDQAAQVSGGSGDDDAHVRSLL